MSDFFGMRAAMNTARAGWLEITLAKIFGKRRAGVDKCGIRIVVHMWRGKIYLTDFDDGGEK